jgi:hypothetical protein
MSGSKRGCGPAPVAAAEILAGRGVARLLTGHQRTGGSELGALATASVGALESHGLLDVLLPYLSSATPSATIAADTFEEVLKHHCVAETRPSNREQRVAPEVGRIWVNLCPAQVYAVGPTAEDGLCEVSECPSG